MYSKKAIGPITGCLVVMLCVGIIYLWSVFSGDIIKAFNWNASSAKMVSSYMLMGFVIGCLIGGILNDKKGPRFTCTLGIILFSLGIGSTAFLTSGTISLIYLTYSLMGGLGSGLAYNAAIPCVQKWMPGRRGLASGIAAAAFGLSTLIVTPISKALMVRFTNISGIVDFKPVFLILSGLFLVIGLIACMFVCTPPIELGLSNGAKNKVSEKNYTLKEAANTVPFWCLFATMFFINATWTLTVPLIKDLGQMRGLTEAAAIFAVSFTGVPNALGRLLMATLSDKIGRMNTLLILSAGTLVAALLMAVAVGYWYIAVVGIIAFCYGGPSPVNAAFCTDFFGSKYSGSNYGFIMLALGLSSICFNAISNKLLLGAPIPTFIMAACTAVVPFICMFILKKHIKKNAKTRRAHLATSPAI